MRVRPSLRATTASRALAVPEHATVQRVAETLRSSGESAQRSVSICVSPPDANDRPAIGERMSCGLGPSRTRIIGGRASTGEQVARRAHRQGGPDEEIVCPASAEPLPNRREAALWGAPPHPPPLHLRAAGASPVDVGCGGSRAAGGRRRWAVSRRARRQRAAYCGRIE